VIPLDELPQNPRRGPPGAAPSVPPAAAGAVDTAGDVDAEETVARAVSFAGLAPSEVRAVVLVGLRSPALVQAAFRQLPGLTGALILAPVQADLRAWLDRTAATGPGSVDPARCFLTEPRASGDPEPRLADYLALLQFFRAIRLSPALALVLGSGEPAAAPALTAARDVCWGFSATLLARTDGAAELSADLLRAAGDLLYDQHERYHALKYYLRAYRSTPRADVAWRILECWSDLRAFEQVRRWLDQPAFPETFRAQLRPEIDSALAEQRTTRQGTLLRNRQALAAHLPEAAARLSDHPADDTTVVELPPLPWLLAYQRGQPTVHRAPYPLLVRVEDDHLVELNPPTHPEAVHRDMTPPEGRSLFHVCVRGWVTHWGAAHILLSTDLASTVPNWHRVINLIEPDASALSRLLEATDLSDRLQPDRVYLFLGPQAEADFLALLAAEPNHAIPGVWFGVEPPLQAALEQIEGGRDQRVLDNVRQLQARHDASFPGRVRDKLAGRDRRPLRVLFLTSRYTSVLQYIASDLASTFAELGHETVVVREARSGQELSFPFVTDQLRAFEPDLVFLTNHTRPEYGRILPPGLPVVTWIQDEMPRLADPAFIAALGPLDLTYGYSTTVQTRYRKLGYPFVGHLPFAVRPVMSPIPDDSQPQVVYVTHLEELAEPADYPGLAPWLERRFLAEHRVPIGTPKIEPLLRDACQALGLSILPENRSSLLFWAAMFARRLDRLRVADAVLAAGLPLRLYGRGWEKVARFAPHVRGVVQPGEPLRQVLRGHKVVLHINGECNLHPRVLEGFCAGGFVLGRHEDSDDLPGETADQLAIGRELHLFRDEGEMVELIRRALEDEGWRRGVIEAARARIAADHTYGNRVEVILRDLRARLGG
jgi:hypothetical protein